MVKDMLRFVKHPTPSFRRHTIEKSNADVVPT
jgi:hypothetical protein